MRRLHLVELEDLPWFPRAIRDGGTDLLNLAFDRLGVYRGVAPALAAVLERTGATQVVDLCSGGGGGLTSVRPRLRDTIRPITFLLTDRYPSMTGIARVKALGDPNTSYHPTPIDAFAATPMTGIRTMFGAIHHFPPAYVQTLIESLVAQGVPVAFFDIAGSPIFRNMPLLLVPVLAAINFLILFTVALLITPFVRPWRWQRFALTYVIPAIPLLFGWDGTVSFMRAYTPNELLAIARAARGAERYEWNAGQKGVALYLTGIPITRS